MLELLSVIYPVSCRILLRVEDLDVAACALKEVAVVGEVEAAAVISGLPANISVLVVDDEVVCAVLIGVEAYDVNDSCRHVCTGGGAAVVLESVSDACLVGADDHVLFTGSNSVNELEDVVAGDGSIGRCLCRSLGGSLGRDDDLAGDGSLLKDIEISRGACSEAAAAAVIQVVGRAVVELELAVGVFPASDGVLLSVIDLDGAALALEVVRAVGEVEALAVLGGLPYDILGGISDKEISRAVGVDIGAEDLHRLGSHACAA